MKNCEIITCVLIIVSGLSWKCFKLLFWWFFFHYRLFQTHMIIAPFKIFFAHFHLWRGKKNFRETVTHERITNNPMPITLWHSKDHFTNEWACNCIFSLTFRWHFVFLNLNSFDTQVGRYFFVELLKTTSSWVI